MAGFEFVTLFLNATNDLATRWLRIHLGETLRDPEKRREPQKLAPNGGITRRVVVAD